MKENINYVVISTEEYKEMIKDKINKENCIRELNTIKKKMQKYIKN